MYISSFVIYILYVLYTLYILYMLYIIYIYVYKIWVNDLVRFDDPIPFDAQIQFDHSIQPRRRSAARGGARGASVRATLIAN